MPNITGLYMDDFFNSAREGQEGSMTVDEVKAIRDRMVINGCRLELGVVVYTKDNFDDKMRPYLELCDEISLWSWSAEELDGLEANFAKLAEIAPGKRLQMGVYMWRRRPPPTHAARTSRTPMHDVVSSGSRNASPT